MLLMETNFERDQIRSTTLLRNIKTNHQSSKPRSRDFSWEVYVILNLFSPSTSSSASRTVYVRAHYFYPKSLRCFWQFYGMKSRCSSEHMEENSGMVSLLVVWSSLLVKFRPPSMPFLPTRFT